MSKHKTKRKSRKSRTVKRVVVLVTIAVCLSLTFFGMYKLEQRIVSKADAAELASLSEQYQEVGHIFNNGIEYKPKPYLKTILLIGLDESGEAEASESFNNSAQADFLALLVLDSDTKTCSVLMINRDTMTEISVLGLTGELAGSVNAQIALSHTYGNGLDQSCRNTVDAVSELLFGAEIDNYVSVNMDAVSIMNDLIGGVEVVVQDDFSAVDPELQQGTTVNLSGEQALIYVRSRYDVGDQTNVERMERQKQYLDTFVTALKNAYISDNDLVYKAYNSLNPYIVTDCSLAVLSDMAEQLSDYTVEEIVSPQGESVVVDNAMEFHVDNEALKELVIKMFYDVCDS